MGFNWRDLLTQIEAYIRGRGLDSIWKIDRHLYQSGDLDSKVAPVVIRWNKIDGIVDLQGDRDPLDVLKEVKWYRYFPIKDGPLPSDMDGFLALVKEANRLSLGGTDILVHCGAGRNRASLFTGCMMHLRGLKGYNIVNYIRKKRPGALDNYVFVNYLNGRV